MPKLYSKLRGLHSAQKKIQKTIANIAWVDCPWHKVTSKAQHLDNYYETSQLTYPPLAAHRSMLNASWPFTKQKEILE